VRLNRLCATFGTAAFVVAISALGPTASAQQIATRAGAGAAIQRPGGGTAVHIYYDDRITRFGGGGGFSKEQFNPDGRLRAPRSIMAPDTTIPVADYDPDVYTTGMSTCVKQLGRPGYRPDPRPLGPIDPKLITSGDQAGIADSIREHKAHDDQLRDPTYQFDTGSRDRACGRPRDNLSLTTAGIDPFVAHGSKPSAASDVPSLAGEPAPSIPEAAAQRLRDGKAEEAIVKLRSYTEENPGDAGAARTLALALLDVRRTGEGIDLMGRTYQQSAALASLPIPADAVGKPQDLRDLLTRVVAEAHKSNTPAAWLTAAVLMQAEGRRESALKMMDRADAANLSAQVSGPMRAALTAVKR
jgi:hypothetical protein